MEKLIELVFFSATMHTLVQLNTSRNELCYKLLNGGIRGDVLRSGEDGGAEGEGAAGGGEVRGGVTVDLGDVG